MLRDAKRQRSIWCQPDGDPALPRCEPQDDDGYFYFPLSLWERVGVRALWCYYLCHAEFISASIVKTRPRDTHGVTVFYYLLRVAVAQTFRAASCDPALLLRKPQDDGGGRFCALALRAAGWRVL